MKLDINIVEVCAACMHASMSPCAAPLTTQASELQNIGDARVIVTEVPAAQLSPVASFRRSASTKANSLGGPAWGSPGPPTPPLATSKVAIYSVASTRIESAVLPVPPLGE